MSDIQLSMSLPLDKDGFLRRECPDCKRQFKWLPTPAAESLGPRYVGSGRVYFCPYCYLPAAPSAWWTSEQLEYAKVLRLQKVWAGVASIPGVLRRMNRPDSLIKITATAPTISSPEPLHEVDDMVRVDVPCHPNEPLKIDADWTEEIACLICGIRYPVALVVALEDATGDE